MSSNIRMGTQFEREFCEFLADKGFWVHQVAPNTVGQQPADVIAVYRGTAYLIDCKVCSGDIFRFSRMEDNQKMAMKEFANRGCGCPVFALKDSKDQVWMLDYGWASEQEASGRAGVPCQKIKAFLIPLEEWLEYVYDYNCE